MNRIRPENPRSASADKARTFSEVFRGAFLVLLVAVFVLAVLPSQTAGSVSFGWDKANHLIAFAALAGTGRLAFPGRAARLLAGLLAYGVLIEIAQALTPDRTAQPADVVADAAGIAVGMLAAAALRRLADRAAARRRPDA